MASGEVPTSSTPNGTAPVTSGGDRGGVQIGGQAGQRRGERGECRFGRGFRVNEEVAADADVGDAGRRRR